MSNWTLLALAGALEVVFALSLKKTQGPGSWPMWLLAGFAMLGSLALLALAMRSLPVGVAYAVWTGIGAVGTAVAGMLLFGEAVTALKLVSLALIVAGMAGLKLGLSG